MRKPEITVSINHRMYQSGRKRKSGIKSDTTRNKSNCNQQGVRNLTKQKDLEVPQNKDKSKECNDAIHEWLEKL